MRAVVQSKYPGAWADVISVRDDVAVPTPGAGEVLIRVGVVSIHAGDFHAQSGDICIVKCMTGCSPQRVPGQDFAGTVAAVGAGVTRHRVGDAVFGLRPDNNFSATGALAQFTVTKEDLVYALPDGVSPEQACCVGTSGMTAVQAMRAGKPFRDGERVLVVGASGGVGTHAVQIAKAMGASHVTGVCSTRNVEMVRGLGADAVVDYTREDYHDGADDSYDRVVDCVGQRRGTLPPTACKGILKPDGVFVSVGASESTCGFIAFALKLTLCAACCGYGGSQTFAFLSSAPDSADLDYMRGLLADGRLRPHVGHRFASLDGAAEAFEVLGSGHAAGKVVVAVDGSAPAVAAGAAAGADADAAAAATGGGEELAS